MVSSEYSFDTALLVALQVHAGQKDKGGEPYILHVIRVAMKMESPELRVGALLHDVLEDCRPEARVAIAGQIQALYGPGMLDLVKVLTRGETESYDVYIARVGEVESARHIKVADLEDNLDPGRAQPNRFGLPAGLHFRYTAALERLRAVDRDSQVFPQRLIVDVENIANASQSKSAA